MRELIAALVLAAAAGLTSGCAGAPSCGGQCHAPYELDVLFDTGVSHTAAVAALRACANEPALVRVGTVDRTRNGRWQGRLFTGTIGRSAETTPLLSCLNSQPGIVDAYWPD